MAHNQPWEETFGVAAQNWCRFLGNLKYQCILQLIVLVCTMSQICQMFPKCVGEFTTPTPDNFELISKVSEWHSLGIKSIRNCALICLTQLSRQSHCYTKRYLGFRGFLCRLKVLKWHSCVSGNMPNFERKILMLFACPSLGYTQTY